MQTQPVCHETIVPLFPEHESQPKKFIPPTILECKLRAAQIGLPDHEAEKFYCYYESNGWHVGKVKMSSWHGAMGGWKLRYSERHAKTTEINGTLSDVQRMIAHQEYNRVLERMKSLWQTYNGMQEWSKGDKEEYKRLIKRKHELKQLLGIMI